MNKLRFNSCNSFVFTKWSYFGKSGKAETKFFVMKVFRYVLRGFTNFY